MYDINMKQISKKSEKCELLILICGDLFIKLTTNQNIR